MHNEIEAHILRQIDDLIASYSFSDIEELIIEDLKLEYLTEPIQKKLEKLTHLESLGFVRCSLRSLDNLPKVEGLLRLYLDHNLIPGHEIPKLSIYKKAISISMMDNKIEHISELKFFEGCDSLAQLNLFKNPVQNQNYYRSRILEWCPQIMFLDNIPRDGSEVLLDEAKIPQKEKTQRGRQKSIPRDAPQMTEDDRSDSDNGRGKRGLRKKVKQ